MRLIKLAAYALLGYVLYELFLGISQEHERQQQSGRGQGGREQGGRSQSGGQSRSSQALDRALNEGTGRMNMTGPGVGAPVATQDPTGATSQHVVGRGVVSR